MQIQNGKLYVNRTWKYLFPCLKSYDKELRSYLSNFLKLKVGIKGSNTDELDNCIFILFQASLFGVFENERRKYSESFDMFLNWVRYQPYYENDYVYNFENCTHMVVLKIPNQHLETFENFKKGNYSLMYSKLQLDEYFSVIENKNNNLDLAIRNTEILKIKRILSKDNSLLKEFVKTVNTKFNTSLEEEDLRDTELDFPLDIKEETI
jgi:hypothetical protein